MSTATVAPDRTIDLSDTPRIPLSRLIAVEVRKLADTRAGKWLLIAIALITAAIIVIFFLTSKESDRTFQNFVGVTGTPQGFLLPVLGILLVTSEWNQRTALTTFTLMPVRGRVLVAKVVAAMIAGVAAYLLAVGVAALATALGGAPGAWDGIGPDNYAKLGLVQLTGVLQGLAFGLLFLNSATAIVIFFVLPTAFTIIAGLWKTLGDAAPWADLNTAQTPLFDSGHMSSLEWRHWASALVIWVVLPFVVGLVRVLRAEVK